MSQQKKYILPPPPLPLHFLSLFLFICICICFLTSHAESDNWHKQIQDMLSHSKNLFESGMDKYKQNGMLLV